MLLNDIGQFAFDNLRDIGVHYPYVEIPLFVVMPNHVHGIVFVDGEKNISSSRDEARLVSTTAINEKMQKISHRQSLLSNAIGGFKSATTKFANTHHIPFAWQTRFHDHIIRNQKEMNRIAEYIENNVAWWDTDCFNQ